MSPWSYVAGRRATKGEPSSSVRVYERSDVPDRIFISMAWDRTTSGRPREHVLPLGTTRVVAEATADETAALRRLEVITGLAARMRGATISVGELLRRYHDSEVAARWGDRHADDARRGRRFWEARLDLAADTLDLSPAIVSRVVGNEERRGMGRRTVRKRLAYIRAAVRWGFDKAQLYDRNPLRGLDLPEYQPDTDALFYDPKDAALLATPHPEVDWRVTLAASIALDAGRRISAILSLAVEDVVTDGAEVFLRFRPEFDKSKRPALVPISAETAELLARALEEPAVTESGWLIPEGRIDYADPAEKPWSRSAAIKGLHRAEATLGIEHVDGRAYHGIKRAHVTAAMEESGGDTALVGDVTGNLSAELLRRVYRRGNRSRSRAHVERVRGRLKGREDTREDTREGPAEITETPTSDTDAT